MDEGKRKRGRPAKPKPTQEPKPFGRPRLPAEQQKPHFAIVKVPEVVKLWMREQAQAMGLTKRKDRGEASYLRYLLVRADWQQEGQATAYREADVPISLAERDWIAYKELAADYGYDSFSSLVYFRVVLPTYFVAGETLPDGGNGGVDD